ncbi:AgmX/PglI C-terminal domain-containing protein [Solimonas marina]|uniref:AgmX/PglI C-terminal domain-containing protein n=1 Tax=Solimonas marina TaxID=2714601 RepID=A0A969WCW1_9GAMM|nr:AgmX/PglI C-terminal domain-containing protein [Solimonas marina]NKF23770.1 AgmX/PglI C-terminal domain-containing protein [Solimonas marina]
MNASFVTAFDGWSFTDDADRRFRKIYRAALIVFVILGIAIPLIKLTGLKSGGGETTEQRYVNILPDAQVADQVEEPKPQPEESKKPPEQPAKSPQPKQDKAPNPPKPQPTQAEQQAQARAVAKNSGVLAMADQLAELRDQSLHGLDSSHALRNDRLTAQAGTGASGGSSDQFAASAASGSGGIGASGSGSETRLQSGAGLGERRTTTVKAPRGTGPDKTKPGQGGDKLIAGRTLEEIQLTFDRNKGAFYAIFNRAMREDPSVGPGKIVVSLTIAPDGSVTDCHVVSSTFNNPDLERKVVQRVKLLNFGAKNVPAFTYPNYPINFLPS